MAGQPLLGNSTITSERQRLLEQLKKLDEKDEQTLQEREALIGKVVVTALKSNKLAHEDFAAFIAPLVTKKSDAKKLGLGFSSQASDQDNSSDVSTGSNADDDDELEPGSEPETSNGPNPANAVDEDEYETA